MIFRRAPKRAGKTPQPMLPGLFGSASETQALHRLATPGEQALGVAHARLAFIFIMFVIIYFVIIGRLINLTLFSDPPDLAGATVTSSDSPSASRADIIDRNGTTVATSLPTISLCANAHKILDPNDATKKLLSVLPDLDAERLSTDLHSAKHCVMIKRHLTPKQTYAINKLGIAGLEFMPDERRIYPSGNLLAHVIGYTDIDNVGLSGIEKSLNNRLQQEPTPVALSIDLKLQMLLQRSLQESVEEYKALAAMGIIMDVTTGEILALVSLPDFDPHRPGTADANAKFNRATLGVFEMGSMFKIFNTAMAIDSGLVHPWDVFDTTHAIETGRHTIKDFHPENHNLNVAEIMMHSSNLGSARIAQRMGVARQRAFLAKLGLTEKLSLETPEVGTPLVPSAQNWNETALMTISYGHGIAVTPVQTAAAVASVTNNGIRIRPTLLKGGFHPDPNDHVISAKSSEQVRAMMRLVVAHGTAKKANVIGYLVGGKTGTADKVSGKKYSEHSRRAGFVGVFPINAPRYLVMAVLDDPQGNTKTYGFANAGWNAAPTVGKIIAQMGPMVGLLPLEEDQAMTDEQQLMRTMGDRTLADLKVETGEDYAAEESDGDSDDEQ